MPKPLVLVLVLVALLVFVLLGLGVAREPGSADPDEHGWVGVFQLGGAPPVEAGHVVASGCFDPATRVFSVGAGLSCTTRIGPEDGPIRLLRLEATGTPPPVRVDFAPRDGDGVEIERWDPDDEDFPLQVPVGPGGGTLTVQCRAPLGGCGLRLASEDRASAQALVGKLGVARRP